MGLGFALEVIAFTDSIFETGAYNQESVPACAEIGFLLYGVR